VWSDIVKSAKNNVRLVGGEKMTNVGELYVCRICGNAVEVVAAGAGRLICCGQPMELVEDDE
jgi:desulfoferrodoxin-like iron-binding protein